MTTATALPEPEIVATRARHILDDWRADAEMTTVLEGCAKYSSDWDDFYGGPLISTYSVDRDARHLLGDALKVMALKSAAYELTGDEVLAELPVPVRSTSPATRCAPSSRPCRGSSSAPGTCSCTPR
ncbi:hypothetical protein ACFZB5_34580 [Streptomyces nodosus]|uniref:hypothetical protein n=1 Tax=Streptomyces nodosus TaxID=40318 RepID=UPI0036F1232E